MKAKIRVDDFLNNRVLTNLKTNGEETYSLFFYNKPNIETDVYDKELYKIDLDTFQIYKIDLEWIPDDFYICYEQIIFKKIKEGQSELYTYHLKTKDLQLMNVLPLEVKEMCIIGDLLYFTASLEKLPKGIVGEGIYDYRLPKYLNNVEKKVTYLFKCDLEGKEIVLLNKLELDIDQVYFDLKYKRIMYTAYKIQSIKTVATDVYTYEINDHLTLKWTDHHYRIGYIGSVSNNHMIFMGIDLRKYSRNDNQDHYMIVRDKKACHLLTKYKDQSNERPGVLTDSRYQVGCPVRIRNGVFYYVTVDRFKDTLRGIDCDGKEFVLDSSLRTIDSYQVFEEGILIAGLDENNLHELYWLQRGKLKKLSSYNEWLKGKNISSPVYVKGSIDGWVIPPIDLIKGKKYPSILMIHGGPKTIYTDVFAYDMQILASQGYYVMYCNPRGSDGRGNEFSNIRGVFGEYAYKDLMDFVDNVLEKYPQIDEKRLGVTGGSYGGYMTNLIITRTSRFKAAVSERGISNIMTAFLSSDIGFQYTFEYMGNKDTPWTNQQMYDQASPLNMANVVKTPTLFAHGRNDIRCHYTESLNMYNALLYHGIETKFSLYEGESHSFTVNGKPSSRFKRYTELLEWFEIFLKGE
ncbi:alpha/beta hydrolase family protein [Marinisporobacter balticus]|uniref:Dipeptidyl aminopeptidase/acylaminoacyl peptidase n=1 Tax=Marinisporobacter balticus TaxID=2018667 RepID=A0A4R2KH77_9FIRM|nr:S9 family peptidase [Marinisporobacter balticus]TCO69348.1 dipeptidyl aminopeptidase/acylaminoacyl peptidase [Marinisporobacter balticus]